MPIQVILWGVHNMLYFYTENLKDKWAALIQGFWVSSFILTGKKKAVEEIWKTTSCWYPAANRNAVISLCFTVLLIWSTTSIIPASDTWYHFCVGKSHWMEKPCYWFRWTWTPVLNQSHPQEHCHPIRFQFSLFCCATSAVCSVTVLMLFP